MVSFYFSEAFLNHTTKVSRIIFNLCQNLLLHCNTRTCLFSGYSLISPFFPKYMGWVRHSRIILNSIQPSLPLLFSTFVLIIILLITLYFLITWPKSLNQLLRIVFLQMMQLLNFNYSSLFISHICLRIIFSTILVLCSGCFGNLCNAKAIQSYMHTIFPDSLTTLL